MILFHDSYENIISIENLLGAWKEFAKGKGKRLDVLEFKMRLMDNLLSLHADLKDGSYRHGHYEHFKVSDPKPRDIHKASVRDRIVHRAIYRKLYPFFDKIFISDSFSCRNGKGTHKALNRFRDFGRRVSRNHTITCWILKCDIRKFFASVDHKKLIGILQRRIIGENTVRLLSLVISSFSADGKDGTGLPLGNLTSQLFANVYMNEFDQFVKHKLKAKFYIRYADDFVFLSEERGQFGPLIQKISAFLEEKLKLSLHPDKVFVKTIASGVDFLGWIHFPDHRVLRTTTKRRMLRNLHTISKSESLLSYFGHLSHGNGWELRQIILRRLDATSYKLYSFGE